ncbi:plastocyanin/azurin family copper-binding protein [Frigidibacter sp. ROC022]|uniref:plastocyanin/azurin family copper-binding protein n=1 Tax=Frigidibacter sp. ROC022 TaxID=2971796 RepID=UPI00215A1DE2|nr:plastocyanin/azurin family copper-binding protein [Frigidibacter sp. ROC022]MCR8725549.1 plastocyanin/azurin family copper-binding protein [Frigidibacter sp. ROC022]
MSVARRQFLALGGGLGAALLAAPALRAAPVEVIEMRGTARGERIWFAPRGLAVAPGTTLRFVNRDPGNSHTATAYHPDNYDRARRIPSAATAWDSDFLLPEESFEVVLDVPGVYDYYCIPHEMAGMAGRIVVGRPGDPGWEDAATDTEDVSPEVLETLPPVAEILSRGRIEGESR